MIVSVIAALDEYHRLYDERDVEGVTNMCLWPFVAIRAGTPIHMPDRAAVRDHFAGAITAYRLGGVASWAKSEIDVRQLGEHSAFTTVHWHASNAEGEVIRDTWTSYQLVATSNGLRFVSYTNHF